MRSPNGRVRLGVAAAAAAALALMPFSATAQAASPAAAAYGANIQLGGQDVVPPTPTASVDKTGDQTNTLIDIPASPVIVNGTLTATANAHPTANVPTGLTVVQQAVPGPYNARGLAQIEGVGVLYEVAGEGIPLVSADVIRSEAAVVCGATPKYTANSEIIDLAVGGNDVPLNAPVQDLIDGISDALTQSGLNAVVDVQRNVVTQNANGASVDALVVTILAAAGDTPLAQVRLAHAEVSSAACAPSTQCSDGVDNDTDAKIDAADPGCHSDGNASNAATYVPTDNDETDEAARSAVGAGVLPRTGAEETVPLTIGALALLAGLGLRLRSRLA